MPTQFDEKTDVLIVGTGGAGLAAALRVHSQGLDPLIIETPQKIGGTSPILWWRPFISNNPISKASGIKGGLEDASLCTDDF